MTAFSPESIDNLRRELSRCLFSDPRLNAYAILDGASNPALLDRLYGDRPEFECLYRGELQPDIAACAPYLAKLEQNTPFCTWLINRCWGLHWGIFALSEADMRTVRQHLRKLNLAYDPATARSLLFRYYDPRVLRIFLPTCDAAQIAEMFGPVQAYFAESDEDESLVHFYRQMPQQP